jgi:hypothetical protein
MFYMLLKHKPDTSKELAAGSRYHFQQSFSRRAMIRLILLSATFAVIAAAPFSAQAGKRYTHNLCRAMTPQGQPITFKCRLDQRCCYAQISNQKYCVSKSATCSLMFPAAVSPPLF